MSTRLIQALTSRAAGPVASGLCAVLAIALAASWTSAAHGRAELEARIDALQAQIARPDVAWAAAPAEPAPGVQPVALTTALAAPPARPAAGSAAEQLLKTAPTGFDACARMQSADEAVLGALGAKK